MENEVKKSRARIKKEETVATLVEKLGRATSIVLADYQGLSASTLSEVKNQLEKEGAELTVAKNTLLSLATKQAGIEVPEEALKGPTAAVLAYDDPITPIKDLAKFQKQYEKPLPKIGFLGSELLSVEKIRELALLPSKQELQAKVVGSISSPIYGIVGVLGANLRNLVYALDQIAKSKGNPNA